jgi:hypothetical protein
MLLLRIFLTSTLLWSRALAIGQDKCVSFTSSSSTFSVVSKGKVAPLVVFKDDWPGVHRAVADFAEDIQRVTGKKPDIFNVSSADGLEVVKGTRPVIVGTLSKSTVIGAVVNNSKTFDVTEVQGKWESFKGQMVGNPLPTVDQAYVIAGADKRGTIFALYDLSEQFGMFISPSLSRIF